MHTRLTLALLALLALNVPGRAQVPVYNLDGVAPGDEAGYRVAGVGDVDGDGWDDVAVGMPYASSPGSFAGRVRVNSGLTGLVIRTWSGANAGDYFGFSVAGIGDVNGDGLADLIIGAPGFDGTVNPNFGRVYIASGAGPYLAAYSGIQPNEQLGYSVAGVGDVDGDGVPDYGFGAPYRDSSGPDSGYFEVRSGATNALRLAVSGYNDGDLMGVSISGVGDIDGDGSDDVVVGAPGYDNTLQFKVDVGRAYVFAYKPQGAQLLTSTLGTWVGGKLGFSVAGVGDVDGDLVPDFAAGAPLADANGVDSGEVRVVSGQTQQILYTIGGPSGARTGWAVAGLGDMNGDGVGEIGVGLPYLSLLNAPNIGLTWAISGLTGQILHGWYGPQDGALLGWSIAGAGDLNKDGRADVVIGMPTFDTGGAIDVGRAMVVLANAPAPQTYCTAKVNSAGCTPQIAWSGAASLSIADNFFITASKILYSVPGVLIWSPAIGSTPFGGGTLCLGGQITRTSGQFSGGIFGLVCSGSFSFQFSKAYMASMGLVAGTTLYAQFWSRDQGFAAPNNMNLTDAVDFDVLP